VQDPFFDREVSGREGDGLEGIIKAMQQNGYVCSQFSFVVLAVMSVFLEGCVSLQIPSADGKPKIYGFGYAKSVGGPKGEVYQLVAPGLSVRLGSASPGVSLGWHETRFFYPTNTSSFLQPVAIQTKCIGVDFGFNYVMAGYDSIFAIPLPEQTNVMQLISYSENNPTNTIVEQKEIE
jgi:hypothetical protein